jgi:hypothetical protein
VFAGQGLQAAQVSVPSSTAHLDRKSDDPIGEQTAPIHKEVHHVGVIGVLRSAQSCLHHGKPGLHEHDQEACDQGPGEVDADFVLANLVGYVAQCEAGLGIPTGTSLTVPVMVPPGSPAACVAVVGALVAASFSSAADGGGAASARATTLAPANSTIAMAQIQNAKRAFLIYSAPGLNVIGVGG